MTLKGKEVTCSESTSCCEVIKSSNPSFYPPPNSFPITTLYTEPSSSSLSTRFSSISEAQTAWLISCDVWVQGGLMIQTQPMLLRRKVKDTIPHRDLQLAISDHINVINDLGRCRSNNPMEVLLQERSDVLRFKALQCSHVLGWTVGAFV